VGEGIYNTFVIMRRLVWEFLNSKFEGVVIYRRVWDLVDSCKEEFLNKNGIGIIQFTRYHSGKEVRVRVNSHVKRDIKSYFDIHEIDIEMYVLEWCRDKAIDVETVEM
jgi:hypothetical protein